MTAVDFPNRLEVEAAEPEQELLTMNFGPHHPATHGVLRLLTTLEGETVRDVKPIIGYVHTGIEKSCEDHESDYTRGSNAHGAEGQR